MGADIMWCFFLTLKLKVSIKQSLCIYPETGHRERHIWLGSLFEGRSRAHTAVFLPLSPNAQKWLPAKIFKLQWENMFLFYRRFEMSSSASLLAQILYSIEICLAPRWLNVKPSSGWDRRGPTVTRRGANFCSTAISCSTPSQSSRSSPSWSTVSGTVVPKSVES
jgi:hypothetical protein